MNGGRTEYRFIIYMIKEGRYTAKVEHRVRDSFLSKQFYAKGNKYILLLTIPFSKFKTRRKC